jgi:malonyl CoA-acyl carrier protein transacylase
MEVRRFLLGGRTFTGTPPKDEREVVFLFPGQGAQHAGMVSGLHEREPAFLEALDECRAVLEPLGIDLPGLLETDLAETADAQPALFAVEYALARLWISRGVKPAAVLGHSLGEYVAACVAGVFSLPDALRLVVRRGRLMQSAPEGAMLAVPLPEAEIELDGEVEIAAVNAPDRCVLTGHPVAIEQLRQRLAERGVDAKPLPVRRAFHSRSLEPVLEDFVAEVRRARPQPLEIPWLSNLTGTWMTPEQATDPESWGAALRRPVRFVPAVAELLRDSRRVLLEVGPGRTLSSLVRRQKGEAIPSLPSDLSPREGLLEALGRLWLAGVEIDWSAVGTPGPRVSLPTYPFERKRFWVEPAKPVLAAPVWKESPRAVAGDLRSEKAAWLAISEGETGARIVQRLQAERLEPVVAVPGSGFSRLSAGAFTVDPRRAEDFEALLATMPDGPLRIVYAGETGFEVLAEALRGRFGIQVDAIVRGTVALGIARAASLPCRVLDVEPPPLAGTPEAGQWADRVLAEIAAPFEPGTATAWWGGRRWREARKEAVLPKGFDLDLAVEPPPETPVAEATDPLVASHAARILHAAAPGPETTVAELRERLRLVPKYEPLLDFLLRVTREDGLVAVGGERVRFLREAPDPAEVRRGLAARFPSFSHLHGLIDHCARHYPAALSGEVPGISVLYPEGDSRLFKAADKNPAALLLRDILAAAARERPLRVLEVGAGQGTLTAELLPVLSGSEYWFTDLGRSFVLRAEQRARAAGQDLLHFGILDITRDPAAQGFTPGSFDAVVGSDVVHATPRLAETLAHLRSLLAPGGLLGLVETVRSRRWGTLVWGLTDGWWSFEDTELRRDSPLLPPEAWEELLGRCGFERARAFPAGESALLAALQPEEIVIPVPSPAPAVLHDRPLLQNPYVAPQGETERAIAEIWSRALGIERIGAHDSFLELGGDSLVGLQVVHAVQSRFDLGGCTFSLYEQPTVAAIARFVEGDEGSAEGDPFELRSSRGELRRERSTRLKRIRS